MVACNKMYIPLKASQPDIETSNHIIQLIKYKVFDTHKHSKRAKIDFFHFIRIKN